MDENQPSTSGCNEEAGRGFRLKRKQVDPIVCPVCGVTLRTSEVEMHLMSEIEKLNKIPPPKVRINGRNIPSSSSSNCTSIRNTSTLHKDKKWEIYQKVRSNRQSRQKVKSRKRKSEEILCPICNKDISSTTEDLMFHVEMCLRRSESSNENEDSGETIDVEAFEEYEWAGQSRIRATSLLPGGVSSLGSSLTMVDDDEDLNVEDVEDTQMYGAPQYSECDIILPCGDKDNLALRKAVIGSDPIMVSDIPEVNSCSQDESANKCGSEKGADPIVQVLKAKIRELENREQFREDNYKCLICMDKYRTPVISVCCWHVHCEQCWLQTLGAKKLCPQCNMITSPSDLRRIYM
ncbi:E3 ubiquitin-protein ligase Rnf220 [Coccinella septempunctata]|uniref:E3 ubiquitin-protein ligase Rnf220 n=1 Tax=Coccinella septempunctata TaxID=41139 RepID=UPI001D087BDE|nr:E3 ubiquitin-protein ligase Rnf220 [Coccinella septempunctata]